MTDFITQIEKHCLVCLKKNKQTDGGAGGVAEKVRVPS
jgi:hypothetical protein